MISCNVRPSYLGRQPSLYTRKEHIHSTKTLPTLSFRNFLLRSSSPRVLRSAIPAALKINYSIRSRVIAAGIGRASGDPPSDEEENDSLNRRSTLNKETKKELALNFKTLFLKFLHQALTATAVFSSIALALLAFTPTLLSHPSGLKTALNLVNATIPAVTVEIDSVKAGWRRPLEIRGVKIISKVEQLDHHRKDKKKSDEDNNKNSNNTATRTLVNIERIKSTATLLDLSILGRPSDVIVTAPKVDLTMNDKGNLRLVQALQDAGIAPLPRNGIETLNTSEKEEEKQHETPALMVGAAAGTGSRSSLQEVAASIPFSGEIRAGNVHLALNLGQFLAPAEFQEIFDNANSKTTTTSSDGGEEILTTDVAAATAASEVPQLHFEVLLGGEIIEEEAKLEEQHAGFVDKEEESSSLAEWARQKPLVQLPPDVGYLTSPVAVRVDSHALRCTLAGWRTSAGYTYLASPVEAEMNLTPKLARILMNRLNPLLGDAVELRGSSKIAVWITPSDQIWPSNRLDLRLDPLRLNIGQGAAISRGLQVLKLADRKIAAAAQTATLQVDISPIRAGIAADGKIVTKRVDLAVGIPGLGRPLHLVSYGTAHTSPTGAINMVLAIPADALELAGITGLPDDFGVPITVKGTVAKPNVELVKASKEVALLLIEAKAKKVGPRSAEWMWQELKLGGNRSKFRIPEE